MIARRAEIEAALEEARAGLADLCARYPDNAALAAAQRQLAHVSAWLRAGGPSREQLAQLSFGLIAAREIEPLDLPLAERLYELAEALGRLRPAG